LDQNDITFTLGSLIYPKEMLKVAEKQSEKIKVIKIYNYLYKFSLERLHLLLRTKSMVFLILFYLREN